jgi:hypothetical protein
MSPELLQHLHLLVTCFPFPWASLTKVGYWCHTILCREMFKVLSSQTFTFISVDNEWKFLKTPNYGNKLKLRLEYKAWNMSVWTWLFVKKQNRKMVWINFINTEEQRESMAYITSKRTNIVPFLHEFILMKFILWFQFVTVQHNEIRSVIQMQCLGTGTRNGSELLHVCYKQGYFHYECDKTNMSFDWGQN